MDTTLDMAAEVQNGTWNPGANYAPFVDQMRAPEAKASSVADLPAPKRREHIIKEFSSAIGTSVYEGRIKGDKKLGYFRPKIEEVRIKHANDIEVAGHEIAHLIDFRVPELKKAWTTDKELNAELKSVSYDQKNVREGWAEGTRLWLTQPETLEAKAPKVFAFIEDFANRHTYGKALRTAQEQMTGWFGQDNPFSFKVRVLDYAPDARRFDTGTPPVVNAFAARAGMEIINEVGVANIWSHIRRLSQVCTQTALGKGLAVASPLDPDQKGSTTAIVVPDAHGVEAALKRRGIIAAARAGMIRIAPHFFTTREDIEAALDNLAAVLSKKEYEVH